MLPYLYIIKTKFLVALAYRFNLFTTIIGEILVLAATVCFWYAAYGGREIVAGRSARQMIDYTMLSLLLGIFYSTTIEDQIRQSIRKGNVAVDFIKPV